MKLFPAIILLFFSSILYAQPEKSAPNLIWYDDRPLNFGFLIGINTMDYRVVHKQEIEAGVPRRYADVINLSPGINLGMVTNFRINRYFNLRLLPGFSMGGRDLMFSNGADTIVYEIINQYKNVEFNAFFLEFPVSIKFNGARMINAKPYFSAGFNIRYDVMGNNPKFGILLNRFDIYWEIGAGIDSYLTYFRLSTEFKISIGTFNVLNPKGTDDKFEDLYYTNPLEKLYSRIFVLTFYFE